MQTLPHSVSQLIKQLDKDYPPVTPLDDIHDRELWGKIYQRRLIDNLLFLLKEPPLQEKD